MRDIVEKEKKRIEDFLFNSDEHQDKKIEYILFNENTNETNTLASNDYGDEAIEFAPYTKNNKDGYSNVPEWDYNFDYYIYNFLEENWDIGYMEDHVHYSIWNSINELYPEEIEYKEGVQKYLQFCADNRITKEYLDNISGQDVPDIMTHFEGLRMSDTMKYKGYVIEADEINVDNPKENLVNIYKNNRDYKNKVIMETISLKTLNLKSNVTNYIDTNYQDRKVESAKDKKHKDMER